MTPTMPSMAGPLAALFQGAQPEADPSQAPDPTLQTPETPQATSIQDVLNPMAAQAVKDLAKKSEEHKKLRALLTKQEELLTDADVEPSPSQKVQRKYDTEIAPRNKQLNDHADQIMSRPPDDINAMLKQTLGMDPASDGSMPTYAQQRLAGATKGKLGSAMLFLSDVLRGGKGVSPYEANREAARQEYQDALKQVQDQATANKNNDTNQAKYFKDAVGMADKQFQEQKGMAQLEEQDKNRAFSQIFKAATILQGDTKNLDAASQHDVQNAEKMYTAMYGDKPAEQTFTAIWQHFRQQGMDDAAAKASAQAMVLAMEGLKRGAIKVGSTSVNTPPTQNPDGSINPGNRNTQAQFGNVAAPNVMSMLQSLAGKSGGIQLGQSPVPQGGMTPPAAPPMGGQPPAAMPPASPVQQLLQRAKPQGVPTQGAAPTAAKTAGTNPLDVPDDPLSPGPKIWDENQKRNEARHNATAAANVTHDITSQAIQAGLSGQDKNFIGLIPHLGQQMRAMFGDVPESEAFLKNQVTRNTMSSLKATLNQRISNQEIGWWSKAMPDDINSYQNYLKAAAVNDIQASLAAERVGKSKVRLEPKDEAKLNGEVSRVVAAVEHAKQDPAWAKSHESQLTVRTARQILDAPDRIRVKRNGIEGTISADQFNPAMDKKL